MYRIAIKNKRGLKIGLNSLTLEQARDVKSRLSVKAKVIIITEAYVFGEEAFKEVK